MNMAVFGLMFSAMILFAAVASFKWTAPLKQDAGPIQVCSGDSIHLLWNYTLDSGERVKAMMWGCHLEGRKEEVMATRVDRHFVPMAPYSGRLAHLKDAGLEVSCATIQESGSYSISISTESQDNVLSVHRKDVSVEVVDTPKTYSGEIYVTKKPEAVRDVTTGAFHVELSCGNFSDRGHPAIDVTWTAPTGQRLSSSRFQDGFFQLRVANPPVGGNYCCTVPPSLPAARCLSDKSPVLDTACVHLGELESRFTLLEARYLVLESLHQDLNSSVESLHQDLNSSVQSLHQDLNSSVESLHQDLNSSVESLHQDLKSSVQFLHQDLNSSMQSLHQDLNSMQSLHQDLNSSVQSLHYDLNSSVQGVNSKVDALETRIEQATTPVHFQAKLRRDITLSSGSILKLTEVISNQGGAYDPTTGMFTAPLNGSYVMLATTGSYSNEWYDLVIKKEGTVVARISEYMENDDYDMSTCHAALYLMSGERVWLESSGSNYYFWSSITYFTGFRIM